MNLFIMNGIVPELRFQHMFLCFIFLLCNFGCSSLPTFDYTQLHVAQQEDATNATSRELYHYYLTETGDKVRHGPWMTLQRDSLVVVEEGFYVHGRRHEVVRAYSSDGVLTNAHLYTKRQLVAEGFDYGTLRIHYADVEHPEILKQARPAPVLEEISHDESNGSHHGSWIRLPKSPEVESVWCSMDTTEGFYVHGQTHGLERSYDRRTGMLVALRRHESGKLNGRWECYEYITNDCRLSLCGAYRDGKLHGIQMSYYSATDGGRPASRETYRDGLRDGEWIEWDPDGAESCRHIYRNDYLWEGVLDDRPHPDTEEVWPHHEKFEIHAGELNGEYLLYGTNGSVVCRGTFKDGHPWTGTFRMAVLPTLGLTNSVEHLIGLIDFREGRTVTPLPGVSRKSTLQKLAAIRLPEVYFPSATTQEVLTFLSDASQVFDSDRIGIPILAYGPIEGIPDMSFSSLCATNIGLGETLATTASMVKCRVRVNEQGFVEFFPGAPRPGDLNYSKLTELREHE